MADARVVAGITNKVDKESGKGLSTNDYTTSEKTKLSAHTLGNRIGDILYWNGSSWILLPRGINGQALVLNSNIPSWQSTSSFLLAPTIISTSASNIQPFAATLNATVNANNLSTDVLFEWGTSSGYGNTAPSVSQRVTGSSVNSVSASLSLQSATTYHYRVKATNAVNTVFSGNQTFTTLPSAPLLTTTSVTAITAYTATSGGNISWDGGSAVTVRGVCWGTNSEPTIANNKTDDGAGVGSFRSSITGLSENTIFNVRAYATNSTGTAYGNNESFSTNNSKLIGFFTDIRDGRIYNWVQIGLQYWMTQNMAYLPSVSPTSDHSDTSPYFYVHSYDGNNINNAKATTNYTTYGVLYNWEAAKNACPSGWHLPTDAEWKILTDYLGGLTVAGGKLKEIGTTHWKSPNTGATNESGFTSLSGGNYSSGGSFYFLSDYAFFWTATEIPASGSMASGAGYVTLYYYNDDVSIGRASRGAGFSVRCVKD